MKTIDLTGKKFSRLTVLHRIQKPEHRKKDTAAFWLCKCDCGKEVVVRGYSLRINKTKSCGCLNDECSQLNKYKIAKLSHEESVAKRLWRRNGRYTSIPFENFINLIQQNCHYCKESPSLTKKSLRKESKTFYYGTLDRIDSNKDHVLDNVVPCCYTCNRAKSNRTIDDFIDYLSKIKINKLIDIIDFKKSIKLLDLNNLNKQYLTAIKIAYSPYTYEKPGNLTLEQFYTLSSMNCYYCGESPKNIKKYESTRSGSNYIYNGLDRVDNNLPHDYENCVPCCKYCNFAKGELTLSEFKKWIDRFKNF